MQKIYKYFSSGTLPLVFQKPSFCGVKCSLPKDYNDPYELFLGMDLTVPSDLLAVYREIVYDMPQYPTTCFSKSPNVTPMWAHYAENHSGFVLEYDVDRLKKCFDEVAIRDVDYRDSPDGSIVGYLQRAAVTKKPRHAVWLQDAVISGAYFSKQTAWSYEQECRLIDPNTYCDDVGGNRILPIPIECVSAIIVGGNAAVATTDLSVEIAEKNKFKWYQSVIGKSSAQPFFKDSSGVVSIFSETAILPASNTCESCSEPISDSAKKCPWCGITEADEMKAAMGNPLRVLDHFGMLEEYYQGANEIARSAKNKRR